MSVFLLHGFLGRPTDWDESIAAMKAPSKECPPLVCVDYFNIPCLSPGTSLIDWGDRFSEWVVNQYGNGRHGLVGYSLGGRLALHALELRPDLFNYGVCISTNPGLSSSGESAKRQQRYLADEVWAKRFLHESWNTLMKEWNGQEVFQGDRSEPRSRLENNFSRKFLAQALTQWSLAKQKDFRLYLRKPLQQLTWITGSEDRIFMDIADGLKRGACPLDFRVVAQSGHRVLSDTPKDLGKILQEKIKAFF